MDNVNVTLHLTDKDVDNLLVALHDSMVKEEEYVEKWGDTLTEKQKRDSGEFTLWIANMKAHIRFHMREH